LQVICPGSSSAGNANGQTGLGERFVGLTVGERGTAFDWYHPAPGDPGRFQRCVITRLPAARFIRSGATSKISVIKEINMKWLAIMAVLVVFAYLLMARVTHAGELPQVGNPAPDFDLPDQQGRQHRLADYRGKWLVLYFYPKDDTPGCTQEACAFRDDLNQLTELGAQVVGISVDDSESHAQFAKKYNLPFPLLADKTSETAARYGALMRLGIVKFARRYTFLIDPQGNIGKVYLTVETSRHSKEIIEDLKQLTKGSKLQ
jgi:peroxiredoxin Q/BCP